ncbi:MAG: Gp49 family protein [Acidovorax sp.]|uniref:Gp49 family protein n=1 Tax=Acidovorax sp. TaxID=1872122 RepID=UPI003918DBE4
MNPPFIKPTVGRVVWFYPSQNTAEAGFARHADGGGPYAALIAHVWNDRMVNLSVFDANGAAHPRTSVTLHQGEGDVPEQAFCGWMPYQKGQAAKTEAAEQAVSAPAEYRQVTHREELERLLVSGAANRIAHAPEIATSIAKGIKMALDELVPVKGQGPQIATAIPADVFCADPEKFGVIAIDVRKEFDFSSDSLERAMESKTYPDGTTAFGPAPLPDVSPALWAKPLAKEVPEMTVSLSDLGLEREIQAKANKGPRVTPADVEAEIAAEFYFTAADGVLGQSEMGTRSAAWTNLDQVTICTMVLRNGSKVLGVNYGAIDRAQHDAGKGREAARAEAVEKIWELLGFRLRDELARPVLTDSDAAADLAGTPRPT